MLCRLEEACPAEFRAFVFHNDQHAILWHRLTAFQLVSLTLVAEQMLLALPAYEEARALPLVLPGKRQKPLVNPAVVLRISAANVGAMAVAAELAHHTKGLTIHEPPSDASDSVGAGFSSSQLPRLTGGQGSTAADAALLRSRSTRGRLIAAFSARWSGSNLGEPTHLLLYLTRSTFAGPAGELLAIELRQARGEGLPIVMVHECDPAAGGCTFAEIIASTPRDLVEDQPGQRGLYGALAIAWYPPPYRTASIELVAQSLSGVAAHEQVAWRATSACCALTTEVVACCLDGLRLRPQPAEAEDTGKDNLRTQGGLMVVRPSTSGGRARVNDGADGAQDRL